MEKENTKNTSQEGGSSGVKEGMGMSGCCACCGSAESAGGRAAKMMEFCRGMADPGNREKMEQMMKMFFSQAKAEK